MGDGIVTELKNRYFMSSFINKGKKAPKYYAFSNTNDNKKDYYLFARVKTSETYPLAHQKARTWLEAANYRQIIGLQIRLTNIVSNFKSKQLAHTIYHRSPYGSIRT